MTEGRGAGGRRETSENFNGIGMTSLRTRSRLIQRIAEQGIRDQRVLDAMASVPRHIFVDEALAHRAYEDASLPIGYGQTLSQPYIVARMTQLVLSALQRRQAELESLADQRGRRTLKVLEIGTGSGYQTAVLAACCQQVFTVERIAGLLAQAQNRFHRLGLDAVRSRLADGLLGWPDRSQRFDVILATASPETVPEALLEQLEDGGTLILPLGNTQQYLTTVTRRGAEYLSTRIEPVRFVPLLGGVLDSMVPNR